MATFRDDHHFFEDALAAAFCSQFSIILQGQVHNSSVVWIEKIGCYRLLDPFCLVAHSFGHFNQELFSPTAVILGVNEDTGPFFKGFVHNLVHNKLKGI